jgi:hypothetical protein
MPADPPGTPDAAARAARLLELITSSWMSHAALVAAELRIADLLRDGPRTADDLAVATSTHGPSLRRLLQALCALDLCRERDDGAFEITETGALLGAAAPLSLRHWAIWWGAHLGPVWGQLLHSVRTGRSARTLLHGTEGFGHLDRDPETAAVFHRALRELTRLAAAHVVTACDFSRFARVVDVGGGHGELLAAVLAASPSSRGVVYDLPHARDGAERAIADAGLSGRCEFAAGDFFHSVPVGADAYLVKSVLHDWDDADAARILAAVRRALTGAARLFVVEQVLPDRRTPTDVHRSLSRSDLTMLVALAGRERTESEFRALLAAAGFDVVRVVPAGPTFSVIETVARG